MNRVETVEIELGDQTSPNSARRALEQQRDAIRQAFAAFERGGQPYSVAVTLNGRSDSTIDVMGTCSLLERLLAGIEPESEGLHSVMARWIRDWSIPRVTLTLAEPQPDREPAGVLLVEHAIKCDAGSLADRFLIEDIRKTLTDHVMARPDSEYAIAIKMPVQPDVRPRSALLDGLALARSAVAALPVETPDRPNVHELRVCLGHGDGDVLLRIWRLGIMKVPSSSRVV